LACIIKIERDKHLENTEQSREDWAIVYDQDFVLKTPIFHNLETGDKYCDIWGGIAYPSVSLSGCIIVIGVILQDDQPVFKILEAVEEKEIFELFRKLIKLRVKYGFGMDARLLPWWIGEPDKFQPLVSRLTQKLEEELGEGRGIYIKPPVDFGEKYSFPLYIRQLFRSRDLKLRDPVYLELNGFQNISSYAQAIQSEDAEKGNYEDFPMVGLLGGMMHTLLTQMPWMEDSQAGQAFHLED